MNISRQPLTETKYPVLVLILLLAFFLRVNGLAFGLPYVYHDDEHQYVDAGVAFLQGQDETLAQLEQLNNPPLFKTALGLFYLTAASLAPGDLPRVIESVNWRTFFHYAGRLAAATAGLLAVALTFALGRRLYNQNVGLLAALFLAVSFLAVRESHFAVNDAPLTLLVAATLYLAAGILRRGRWFHYLATGGLIGLAVATKYSGIYLVTVLLAAHGFYQYQRRAGWQQALLSWRLWVGLALIPLSFALAAPVAVMNWPEMLRKMGQLSEYGQLGYHDLLLDPAGGWIFYLKTLGWGAGWPMVVAFGAVVLVALLGRNPADLLLVLFPLLLYLLMGSQQMFFVRFILPVLPPLLALVAVSLFRLEGWSRQRAPRLPPNAALVTTSIVLILQPLAMSLWFGVVLNRTDTRQLAVEWLRQNIPAGSILYTEIHAVPRYDVTGRVKLPYIQEKDQSFAGDNHLARLEARGVQYVVTSDFHNERTFTAPATESGRRRWLDELAGLTPLAEFQPYWRPGHWFSFDQRYGPWSETLLRQRPGPVIRVYALPAAAKWHWLNPLDKAQQIPGRLAVFGYDVSGPAPNGRLNVGVYWLKGEDWQASDKISVALKDAAGFEIVRNLTQPSAGLDNATDDETKLFKNEAQLQLPSGTPPGDYRLQLTLVDSTTDVALGGLNLDSAVVTLAQPLSLRAEANAAPVVAGIAPGLDLLSFNVDKTLMTGQTNWLVLLWRANKKIDGNYQVQLSLLDDSGSVAAQWQGPPVHGSYPTARWQAGQLIRDPWNLSLPADFLAGDYHVLLALLKEGEVVSRAPLATIAASRPTPERPPMQQSLDAVFGDNMAVLLGFNVRAIPDSLNSGLLELDLFWQSVTPTPKNYRVGINLVDEQGQPVLTYQAEPAGGTIPTSAWQPGDIIHDFHALRYENLAMAGRYRLKVSLLDPDSGQPLPVTSHGETTDAAPLLWWP